MKNFKHLIIVALMVAFGCGQAAAEFRFGVKAGLNIDKLHTSNWQDNFSAGNRCGFTGGVMTEFTVPLIGIGFDLSLMYTHMQGSIEDKKGDGSLSKNFLEIPLNLKYKLTLPVVSSFVKPMIFTGPNFAFKLDKHTIFNDFKTKTTQLGWNVGIGLEFVKHLQIAGGYTFGLNNVAKYVGPVNNTLNLSDVKIKNNYWTVTAAWLF